MTELHSKLSMSARSRWSRCPVSVPWSDGLPNESSPNAEEGTTAHGVAEFYVRQRLQLEGAKSGIPPEYQPPAGLDLKGQTVNGWNATLRIHGRAYADFIQSIVAAYPDASIVLEKRVAVEGIDPPLFGTADCLIWIPSIRRLIGIDYKYGFGEVDVGTADAPNEQVAAYLVAAAETFKLAPAELGLAIYQPRRIHGDPGQVLLVDAEWLVRERAKVRAEAERVMAAYAGLITEPVPGDHCRYCPAASRCTATHKTAKTALEASVKASMVHDMTEAEIIALWSVRSAFKHFWEDVEERIDKMATAGAAGLVVKVTQGRKMWADPSATVHTLLALGRVDLLGPCAVGEGLPAIPEALHDQLIKRSAGSRQIIATESADPRTVAATFDKYAQK